MRRSNWVPLIGIVAVAVGGLAYTFSVSNSPELGLDLQGGASVVLEPPSSVDDDSVLDQAIEVIRNRVDALGVAEPEIARQGDAVIVQLPGVKDQRRALELVGQTAELRFRPVLEQLPPPGVDPTTTTTATTAADGSTTTSSTAADGSSTTATTAGDGTSTTTATTATTPTTAADGSSTTASTAADGSTTSTTAGDGTTTTTAPAGATPCEPTPRAQDQPDKEVILLGVAEEGEDPACYRLGPASLRGNSVADAEARFDGSQWTVNLEFTGRGIDRFNELAASCFTPSETCPATGLSSAGGAGVGSVAIVLDGVVQSAPAIQAAEFQRDQVQITGDFSEGEAKDLALVLRYGSLPVQLEPQTVQTVSASLGEDSLRAGLIAGAIGAGLVLIYMLLYYRALGLVVILGLAVWSALQWTIISYLGESQGLALSLAGVTGIVVSIGVTVDSYVVYFERLKDEVKSGRTIRASLDRSFKRAFRTIAIADTSALIGAAVLYWLTVGPVRGFAFFLGLSTLLDLVVTYFFTRPLVAIVGRHPAFTSNPVLGVARGLGAEPVGAR